MKERVCSVEGCNGKHLAKGYCNKHYLQIRKCGKNLEKTSKNEFVLYDTYAEMIIFDKNRNEKARVLIDLESVEEIKKYSWNINNGYITCGKLNVFLHRFIMNCPSNMVVDHINHNPLDNRRCNLRICTQQQNTINKSIQSNNTSGVIGVSWDKRTNKWKAYIQNKKRIHLGYFDTLEQAIEVRKQAEIEYFGEYRNIN